MAELTDVLIPEIDTVDMTDDDMLPGRQDATPGLARYTLGKLKAFFRGGAPLTVGGAFTTALTASEPFLLYTFAESVTFPDNFAGSVGDIETNPAATFVIDVQKNGVSVGSISISTTGVFTFATTGTTVQFVVGDKLKLIGPAVVGTAALVSATLLGVKD